MRTETINTHDIRQGDIILSYGMRLLVDNEPRWVIQGNGLAQWARVIEEDN